MSKNISNLQKIHLDLLTLGSDSTEILRSKSGLDVEISDRSMFKISSIPKIRFFSSKRAFCFENFDFLRNKIDLLNYIKISQEGLILRNILSAYKDVKSDLLNLVKFEGKERKLILIKGKNPLDISLFPFNTYLWIQISHQTVKYWHSS
mmetsp:Transcript_99809/g.149502  ORF Transcript_99809/g.149502 Transcript_99809/m.149502 type:complete len:149 (-) Transcript_99809:111-557(-)